MRRLLPIIISISSAVVIALVVVLIFALNPKCTYIITVKDAEFSVLTDVCFETEKGREVASAEVYNSEDNTYRVRTRKDISELYPTLDGYEFSLESNVESENEKNTFYVTYFAWRKELTVDLSKSYTYKGRVTDYTSESKGIEGVSVIVKNTGLHVAVTDVNGYFEVPQIFSNIELSFEKEGYLFPTVVTSNTGYGLIRQRIDVNHEVEENYVSFELLTFAEIDEIERSKVEGNVYQGSFWTADGIELQEGEVRNLLDYCRIFVNDADMQFVSLNPEVVTVDSNGKLTAQKRGLAEIKIYDANNPSSTFTYDVYIKQKGLVIRSLTWDCTSELLKLGKVVQIKIDAGYVLNGKYEKQEVSYSDFNFTVQTGEGAGYLSVLEDSRGAVTGFDVIGVGEGILRVSLADNPGRTWTKNFSSTFSNDTVKTLVQSIKKQATYDYDTLQQIGSGGEWGDFPPLTGDMRDLSDFNVLTRINCFDLSGATAYDEAQINQVLPKLTNIKILSLNGKWNQEKISSGVYNTDCLSNMVNLEKLYLSYNNIRDIDFLAKLYNLKYIDLSNNDISDISPIYRKESPTAQKADIIELYLQNTNVSDIDFVANLSEIQVLNVANTQVKNISGKISNSIAVLNLSNTGVETLSFLDDPSNLVYLNIEKNESSNVSGIQDISVLISSSKLMEFYAANNDIETIEALSASALLEVVDLTNNNISNYEMVVLSDNENLKEVYLSGNSDISDISFLSIDKVQSNITALALDSISPLVNTSNLCEYIKECTNLKILHLNNLGITEKEFLNNLTGLTSLHFSNNKVGNMDIIATFTGLNDLELAGVGITSTAFLNSLLLLETLDISNNVSLESIDVGPLSKLKYFDARGCKALREVGRFNSKIEYIDLNATAVQGLYIVDILASLKHLDIGNINPSNFKTAFSSISAALNDILPQCSNSIEYLNISGNPVISSLQYDNIQYTALKHLDISNCSKIETISAITSAVVFIDCRYTKIGSLDFLKDVSKLEYLNIAKADGASNNKISDISTLQNAGELLRFLAPNNNLESLDALSSSKKLLVLDVANNKIQNTSFKTTVPNFICLQELYIGGNTNISDISCLGADCFKENIVRLNIGGNTKISANAVSKYVGGLYKLTWLELYGLTSDAYVSWIPDKKLPNLQRLKISYSISDKQITRIRNAYGWTASDGVMDGIYLDFGA